MPPLLLLLLRLLLVLLLALPLLGEATQSPLMFKKGGRLLGVPACLFDLNLIKVNLPKLVDCLANSGNYTAFFEDTMWKAILASRRAYYYLETLPQESFENTPFKYLNDVLKIQDSVVRMECPRKLWVAQAIRRKLWNVMIQNEGDTELFKWPHPKNFDVNIDDTIPYIQDVDPKGAAATFSDLACVILKAIKRRGKGNKNP